MTMKRTKTKTMTAGVAALALGVTLAAGMAFAQGPGGRGPRGGHGDGGDFLGPMAATALGLSDAQKAEIKSIFEQTREANRSIREQLKPIHEQQRAAVKEGKSDAELHALANSAAPLMAQLRASRLVAQAKMYKVLTPEQREKLESLRSNMRDRMERRMHKRGAER